MFSASLVEEIYRTHDYIKNNKLQIIKLFEDTVGTLKCLKQKAFRRGKGALAN